jgi:hypothetical protein
MSFEFVLVAGLLDPKEKHSKHCFRLQVMRIQDLVSDCQTTKQAIKTGLSVNPANEPRPLVEYRRDTVELQLRFGNEPLRT